MYNKNPYTVRLHALSQTTPVGLETALQAILLNQFHGNIESMVEDIIINVSSITEKSIIKWAQNIYPLTDPREHEYTRSDFSDLITEYSQITTSLVAKDLFKVLIHHHFNLESVLAIFVYGCTDPSSLPEVAHDFSKINP